MGFIHCRLTRSSPWKPINMCGCVWSNSKVHVPQDTVKSHDYHVISSRILVFFWYEWVLQFSEPEFEQGGRDVGVGQLLHWQLPFVQLQLEAIHLINVTGDSVCVCVCV